MNFKDAMELLKSGSKVTRQAWLNQKDGDIFFKLSDNKVRAYRPSFQAFTYDEEIILSDGWLIDGQEGEHTFSDIIPFVQSGLRARLKSWNGSFIFLDKAANFLVLSSNGEFLFTPDFNSFIATDWVVLE